MLVPDDEGGPEANCWRLHGVKEDDALPFVVAGGGIHGQINPPLLARVSLLQSDELPISVLVSDRPLNAFRAVQGCPRNHVWRS